MVVHSLNIRGAEEDEVGLWVQHSSAWWVGLEAAALPSSLVASSCWHSARSEHLAVKAVVVSQ